MSILAELKRRNVIRVALLYVAVAWLILQATDVLGALLELPAWAGKLVVLLLALGLPIAVVVSWLYELTPEGLKRDSQLAPVELRRHETAPRLNVLTLMAAALAVADRTVDDVFAIQADIAGQIAKVLRIAMGAEEPSTIGVRPTTDLEAWQLFLQARYKFRNRTGIADVNEALSLIDSAIVRDPEFARAHSLRAALLAVSPSWTPDLSRPFPQPEARRTLPGARAARVLQERLAGVRP